MATNNACNNKACLGVHEKCSIFLPDLNKSVISGEIFIGVPNWKIQEILFGERRAFTCGQTKGWKP